MAKTRDKSEPALRNTDLSLVKSSSNDLCTSNNSHTHLFISDLHLCASRPHINEAFLRFLQDTAVKASSLYILGDLFEYWAGDDDIDDQFHWQIITAFRHLANSGIKTYFMHGNRDFLITKNFCDTANITLLQDPALIELHGKKILLSHGDALCTDDVAYQTFRRQVRDEKWQSGFLAQPLPVRKQQVEAIRSRSQQEKSQKSASIMDVNTEAVNTLLREQNYPALLIHGHTHRPNQHSITLDGHNITRWVLGDWYEQGSYLACNQDGCKSVRLQPIDIAR